MSIQQSTAEPAAGAAGRPEPGEARQGTDGGLSSGQIGTFDLVFFVVAAAAPLTVLAGVAPIAIAIGGPGAPLGYLISGALLVLFAAGFTAMSLYVRNAGAFYAYVARGLGRTLGVGIAYVAVVSYNLITPGVAAAFGYFAAGSVHDATGADIPWWVFSGICVLAVGVLGWLRVTLSAKVLGVALILEVLTLLIMDGGILGHRGAAALDAHSFDPSTLATGGIAGMFVIVIGAFTGFEATAIYAEEAREPSRTVPRATFIAIGFLALFYSVGAWLIMGAFGTDKAVAMARAAAGPELTFKAGELYVGAWLSDTMHALVIVSAFAATLAFHNAAARYLYALGRERLLPRRLGVVSARHGSPGIAVSAQTVFNLLVIVVGAALAADPFSQVLIWTNSIAVLGIMVMQALAALAVWAFFRRDRRGMSAARVVWSPLIAFAGLALLTVLAVLHFDLLTGASGTVNAVLLAPLPVVLAAGIYIALRIRSRDPQRYARLTNIDVERD
ncbi:MULTISPECIES: APC family permease [unclassified Streptomyces]|uniref:APC family permease n=1 Tax=unclassified Streptomyces TaxID=2593676 RepID=UPI002DDC5E09|nr:MULTISPECIES: APC family permease [unclassified Streptomyces]WSD93906.1 APC family permease [Streptomyces sp. NBC_01474]